jgi:hypothetical protein
MAEWQIAAGDGNRDYSDVFLKYGVILVGPGSEGPYHENKEVYDNDESWATQPKDGEDATHNVQKNIDRKMHISQTHFH